MLITKHGDTVRLDSRNGLDKAYCFPELVDEIRPIRHDFVADGELVILNENGCPQWERLQKRHVIKNPQRIRRASIEDPAAIFCFDLLWLDGADFRKRTLFERKDALRGVLPANRRVRYARHMNDSSAEIWHLAVQMDVPRAGRRSRQRLVLSGRSSGDQNGRTQP